MKSDLVQPVLLIANVAMARLIQSLGLEPDVLAGHSLGEYAALVVAGTISLAEGIRLVHARGQAMDRLSKSGDPGAMAMLTADAATVEAALPAILGYVAIANRNCPTQTIIAGESDAMRRAVMLFAQRGIEGRMLPIAGAFHSELAAALRPDMDRALQDLAVHRPTVPILSGVTGDYHEPSANAATVRELLLDQLDHPVDFVSMVERLYADGVRTFVEVGPKRALTSFVGDILAGRQHTALHAVHPKPGELRQFHRLLGGLMARGFEVRTVGTVGTVRSVRSEVITPSSLSSLSSPSSPSPPSSLSPPSPRRTRCGSELPTNPAYDRGSSSCPRPGSTRSRSSSRATSTTATVSS
jgi:acyl transferase domain-containing protein